MRSRISDYYIMRQNSGQILLVVVLSMVVALTVGLSVASRTISNLKLSKQNEESQRAFNAAEAGIDVAVQKMKVNDLSSKNASFASNGAKYSYSISPEQSTTIMLNGGDIITQATGMDVWMSNYTDFSSPYTGGTVSFYWGDPGQSCTGGASNVMPALEVMALYNPGTLSLYREIYDPCSRVPGATTPTTGDYAIAYRGSVVHEQNSAIFPSTASLTNILLIKVTPIYNSTHMGVHATTGTLPSQGAVITSTGSSGDTVRKIQYFQSYPQIPDELFHYAIISQ